MGSLFFTALTFLFLFLFHSVSAASLSPSPPIAPLAFKCSSPSEEPNRDLNATQTLLHTLTETASKTGFAVVDSDLLAGLMQCRPVLSPAACTACLKSATNTVSSICGNAVAVSAWFDGCYFHHYNTSFAEEFSREIRPSAFRSNDSYASDRDRFAAAIHKLALRLRAAVRVASHHGFSYADDAYGDGDGRHVYAAVECLRSLSPEDCEACLAEATRTAHDCCAGKNGALVVAGDCMVRFESYRFVSLTRADYSSKLSGDTIYDENEKGDYGFREVKMKKVLWNWAVGAACIVGFAMAACLLRRRILSVKVANFPTDI